MWGGEGSDVLSKKRDEGGGEAMGRGREGSRKKKASHSRGVWKEGHRAALTPITLSRITEEGDVKKSSAGT